MKILDGIVKWAVIGWLVMRIWPHPIINLTAVSDWVAAASVLQFGIGGVGVLLRRRATWPVGTCVHCGRDREPGICLGCREAGSSVRPLPGAGGKVAP